MIGLVVSSGRTGFMGFWRVRFGFGLGFRNERDVRFRLELDRFGNTQKRMLEFNNARADRRVFLNMT